MHFNQTFKIDNREIGPGCKPYIIAEMSANHGNNLQNAINIIKAAAKAGADAIKIQTYTADTLTLNSTQEPYKAKGAWEGTYLYDLYKDASMPWEWTEELQKIAKEEGITLFSSPFDFSSVDFLEKLDMPAYKIASPEIIDLPLIKRIAQTKKPIILSTGKATLAQIAETCSTLYSEGVRELAILKCTSEYPASPKDINLKTIAHLQETFKTPVGLSDHTLGSAVPIASVAAGAHIIEKHFLLDSKIETADSFFSATPKELKEIVEGSKMVFDAMGDISYPIEPLPAQRSLIAIKEIKKSQQLQEGINFKSLRPGGGIEPKYKSLVEGRLAAKDIAFGTLLEWSMLA